MLGLEGPDEVYRLYAEGSSGQLPQKLTIWGTTPTALDPSQAPPGKHTAFMWQKVPYALGHDAENWDRDRQKQQHLSTLLEYWRGFAPNLTDENILNKFAYSPLDTERHFPNMTGGDLGVGWLGPDQRGINRPLPGVAPYRTPIQNLYLCGASTHPGGNITGLPGYNAAKAVIDDLGQEPWWSPPNPEELWSKLD
jgi:phytoene dehydrogenase-like protein